MVGNKKIIFHGYLSEQENMQLFKEFGIPEKNIYSARDDLFNIIKFGDIIIFKNIDDLGKDFEEIKSNFDSLVVNGVVLQFLEQSLLNTLGKSEETLKTISFLLQYFIEKQPLKKKIRQEEEKVHIKILLKGKKRS